MIVRVLLVGALAGLVACVAFEQAVLAIIRSEAGDGTHPILAFLLAAAFAFPVLGLTVLGTSLAAWVALRLLQVPRALAVAGLSGVVLATIGCTLLWTGAAYGSVWVCPPVAAGVHGAVWLLVRAVRVR